MAQCYRNSGSLKNGMAAQAHRTSGSFAPRLFNYELYQYICSKCAKSYDRIFHHGEHWNDAKTASFDADQGRDFVR